MVVALQHSSVDVRHSVFKKRKLPGCRNIVLAPAKLTIYPNPADDFVIIEYHLEKQPDAVVEIKDINGAVVRREILGHTQNQVTISTNSWDPGLYIATLKIDGKPVESCKFTHVY